MSEPLTRAERDTLVARIAAAALEVFPPGGVEHESILSHAKKREAYLVLLAEYADRLPRVVVSACPFSGKPLKRVFDPFGTDGPLWHKDRVFTPEEPAPPPSFRVLLGALDLHGRVPKETIETVLVGPPVPYVVPALLGLPGMVAVISRLEMSSGDTAYPIAYFSTEKLAPSSLQQFWTRPELWFDNPDGSRGWTVANDEWDFELAPWIEKGQLRWVKPGDPEHRVLGRDSGERCPYLDLPGERFPQVLAGGQVEIEELPTGDAPQPFEE